MKTFYRYIRPIRFNEDRMEFDTQPKGGICLRFEETLEGGLWFTFSRCHEDDHFNKSLARKVADHRATGFKSDAALLAALPIIPYSEAVDVLTYAVAEVCYGWEPNPNLHPLIIRYIATEWKGFAQSLLTLLDANERECEKARVWYTAVGAMELAQSYHRVMKMPEITPFGINHT